MFYTWTLAVFGLRYSAAAISAFDRPAATNRSTSAPRGVRPSRASSSSSGAGRGQSPDSAARGVRGPVGDLPPGAGVTAQRRPMKARIAGSTHSGPVTRRRATSDRSAMTSTPSHDDHRSDYRQYLPLARLDRFDRFGRPPYRSPPSVNSETEDHVLGKRRVRIVAILAGTLAIIATAAFPATAAPSAVRLRKVQRGTQPVRSGTPGGLPRQGTRSEGRGGRRTTASHSPDSASRMPPPVAPRPRSTATAQACTPALRIPTC